MRIKYTENQIRETARKLIAKTESKILCFHGEMGTGKTTLIKALVQELGGRDTTNSPTFGLVNEYHFDDGALLGYHFDFYRLNDEMEALDLGLEDYLSQEVWIFMEWPEKITSLLPQNKTDIYMEVIDEVTRGIRIF